MHILFADQFSEPGGAQRCLLDLLPALPAEGWSATVAAPGDGSLFPLAEQQGACTRRIRSGPYGHGRKSPRDVARFATELPRLAAALSRILKETRADVVYVNGPRVLPAAALAAGRGTPLIFHAHSYLARTYAALLARAALRYCGGEVIGSCAFVLRPLRDAARRTYIVPVATSFCPPAARAPRPIRRVGLIGRIAPEKGQAEFLAAARRLADSGLRFVVCGAPLMAAPTYCERIKPLADSAPVEWLGWRQDIEAVLAELDLLVVPSAPGEATTRVIPEAFAAGVPVLATRSGGIPEIVRDGDTGFLVDSAEPAALAEAILRLRAAPPDVLGAVTTKARAAWEATHTLAAYRRSIVGIIRQRVGSRVRP